VAPSAFRRLPTSLSFFFCRRFSSCCVLKKCFVVLGEPKTKKKGEKSRTRLFSTFFSFFFVCCMAGGLAAGRWRLN